MSGNHDVAWAAGFFEGEGHIKFVHRKKNGSRWLAIEVAQVHREPLDKLVEIFQLGKVYGPYGPYKNQRQAYHMFVAYGDEAKEIITKLRPYLFHKGQQVDEALAQQKEFLIERETAKTFVC